MPSLREFVPSLKLSGLASAAAGGLVVRDGGLINRHRPTFCDERLRLVRQQVYLLSRMDLRQINSVEAICELSGQPDLHTRIVSNCHSSISLVRLR